MPSLAPGRGVIGFGSSASGGRSIGPATPVRNVIVSDASSKVASMSLNRYRESAPAPAASAPAPASSSLTGSGSGWRDAFKLSDGPKPVPKNKDKEYTFGAVVEAERWRSKLSGAATAPKKDDDKLGSYEGPAQAVWMAERLYGDKPPSAQELEAEEAELRAKRVIGQAWTLAVPVEVHYIERLEETLRRRLGEVEATGTRHLGAGLAARAYFAECDPHRTGRVLLGPFIDTIGRKLNYEFPGRGTVPSSHQVLAALFARCDLARSGSVPAEDFHRALVGAPRSDGRALVGAPRSDGRASGRVTNTIGRLREGLEREAGGYDALRAADARWYAAHKEGGYPTGTLPAKLFINGLLWLATLSRVTLSDADLNALVDAFEPPATTPRGPGRGTEQGPLFSFDEFTLAVRGPPMGPERVRIVRSAYAALKEDANKKQVKPEHLAARYDASRHIGVHEGVLTEEDVALAFLAPWRDDPAHLDDEVTLREFADRYEWISPLFETDEYFEDMMVAAWRLK